VLSLAEIQSEVLAAVCDVRTLVPTYVEAGVDETRRQTRFNIYRNNYYVAVINVLKERFPVTERIVGEEFFKATAREFVERTPPIGQSNLGYGADFPKFLETFPPVADLSYLADVARLEWARFEAAISADEPTVSSQDFNALDPAHAARVHFKLHPSLRALVSGYPVYDIWRTNHEDDDVQSLAGVRTNQAALIARSQIGIEVHETSASAIALIEALRAGLSLGDAYERVSDHLSPQDFSQILATLLAIGAVSSLSIPDLGDVQSVHQEPKHV